MNKKSVHFIGIAGHTMAPIAKMFKDMGWKVTGSDQKAVFPPITTYLEKNNLEFNRGYSENNIAGNLDLVVVGRSALLVDKENPEVVKARTLNCRILSYPEVLSEYLIKENSIVIVGTYGKSTTTTLTAWILEQAAFNPSFMVGGLPSNFEDGVRNTNSSYSVVEGDEPPSMKETDPPKFMFYKPKFVILTAVKWDHPEIFKSESEYIKAFIKFIELIPSDGLLIVCKDGENTEKVAKQAACSVIWYSSKRKADFYLENITFSGESTSFDVVSNSERIRLKTTLFGEHNLQNIAGAVALCRKLGVRIDIIQKAVSTFYGIKMRLENLGNLGGIRLFRDFAQHPIKVQESLAALRTRYPKNKIFCVFDPHANVLQQKESLGWYLHSFDLADQIIVTKVTFPKNKSKDEWVKGSDIVKMISRTHKSVFYEPKDEKVIDLLLEGAKKDDIIVFMSSGGLRIVEMIDQMGRKLTNR